MGTSFSGSTPATTFDSIIKFGDNNPVSSSLKQLSDGNGANLPISMSTDIVDFPQTASLSSEQYLTIAHLDINKGLRSLPTGTYPSLTELSFVKGVTSSIQPQISGNLALLTVVSTSYAALTSSFSAVSTSYASLTASFNTTSASFNVVSGSYASLTASFNAVSTSYASLTASFNAVSTSYASLTASYSVVSASVATLSTASINAISTSLAALTASFSAVSTSYASLTASFSAVSTSYAALTASHNTVSASFIVVSSSFIAVSTSVAALNPSDITALSSSYASLTASYSSTSASFVTVSSSYASLTASFAASTSYYLSGGNFIGPVNFRTGSALSASTIVDIGPSLGNSLNIVGSASISSFSTAQVGTRKYLTFKEALVLINSANLTLPGNVNYSASVDDEWELVSFGSASWDVKSIRVKSGSAENSLNKVTHILSGSSSNTTYYGSKVVYDWVTSSFTTTSSFNTITSSLTAVSTSYAALTASYAIISSSYVNLFSGSTLISNLVLAENKSILLDTALSADGTWSAIVAESGTLGETVAFGEAIYLRASGSKWVKTNASQSSTSGDVRVGICVIAGNDNNGTTIMFRGKIRADSLFPTFTVSGPVMLATSSGAITQTYPNGTDSVTRRIGWANTTDEIDVDVSNDYITHV